MLKRYSAVFYIENEISSTHMYVICKLICKMCKRRGGKSTYRQSTCMLHLHSNPPCRVQLHYLTPQRPHLRVWWCFWVALQGKYWKKRHLYEKNKTNSPKTERFILQFFVGVLWKSTRHLGYHGARINIGNIIGAGDFIEKKNICIKKVITLICVFSIYSLSVSLAHSKCRLILRVRNKSFTNERIHLHSISNGF